jgi:hypothetical protein
VMASCVAVSGGEASDRAWLSCLRKHEPGASEMLSLS